MGEKKNKKVANDSSSQGSSQDEKDGENVNDGYPDEQHSVKLKTNESSIAAKVENEALPTATERNSPLDLNQEREEQPVLQNCSRASSVRGKTDNLDPSENDNSSSSGDETLSDKDSGFEAVKKTNKPKVDNSNTGGKTPIKKPSDTDGKVKYWAKCNILSYLENIPVLLWIALLMGIVSIVLASIPNGGENDSQEQVLPIKDIDVKLIEYRRKIKHLQHLFPNQEQRLWATIRVAIEQHHVTIGNVQPAVLMFVSSEKGTDTADRLAKMIADLYSFGYEEPIIIRGIALKQLNSNDAKLELDQDITENFRRGSKSVIVSRFEEIPARATTTFYQFCENDHAPFKDVAVIITVQVNEGPWSTSLDLDNVPIRLWDKVVNDFILHSLNSRDPEVMTRDMIGGLLSRITPSIAWVRPEENI